MADWKVADHCHIGHHTQQRGDERRWRFDEDDRGRLSGGVGIRCTWVAPGWLARGYSLDQRIARPPRATLTGDHCLTLARLSGAIVEKKAVSGERSVARPLLTQPTRRTWIDS
jgi:hypothetical protein